MQQAIDLGKNFKPLTNSERAALLQKTTEVAMHGEYELYKTSEHFDSTAKHPEYLGQAA